jgi:signal transduction histidine kinase
MPIIEQHIEAARKVYELFWQSYLSGDMDTFASVLDEQLELIGTSESEIAHSKSEGLVLLEAQLHEVVGNVEKRNRKVNSVVIGDLILINELCDIYFRNEQAWNFYSKLRLSTLLRETNEGWKVVQQHGSLPDHRVEGNETIALEKISNENIELRDAVKRRTAELENRNRQLAIEAALEKVRSSALAMKEPSDMVDVCNVISDQLQLMGIRDIRNVQTAIINELKATYLNYQYFAAYKEGVTEETDYNNHPTVHAMVREMKKSVNSTFSGSMEGAELISFREWRKQNNQFPDPLLDEVESVHYYFYSIGQGGLGLSTYKPLSEEGHKIFKRFHNVFTLAYRRFTDIEVALAQSRKAQIEAALERIRSRALAMHNSAEVGDVSDLLFSELEKMDINPTGFSIMVFDRERDKYELWRAKDVAHQGVYETFSINAMYDKLDQYIPGFAEDLESRWNSGAPFFIAELSGKRRISFIEANREMGNYTEDQFENILRIYPDPIFWHLIFFKHGWLGLVQNEQLPEDDLLVIRRFAEVFDFAYTRFLDLQKAESQAREAQIELSLERIRAQVTAMQESSDLLDIVVTMRTEFVGLGHEGHYFWYMRWLPEKYEKAMTSGDGTRIGMVMSLPRHIHGDIPLVANWEKGDEPTLVFAMDVETAVDYVHKMIALGDFEQVDPQAPTLDDIRHIGGLTFIMARTTHGEIGFSLPGTVPDPPKDAVETLARFAGVFDLAYRRFEDLKRTERQHREARIELSLERTRTQSMLMQHSSELNEISKTFHEQLLLLGIDSEFSFVWLPDEEKQEHMFWATWASEVNGTFHYRSKAIKYPLDKTEPGTAACYVAWESGQPVHETFVSPGEIVSFFAVWEELLRGADQFKSELFPDGIYYTEAYMKYGCFGIDIRRQLSDDEKEILRRFSVEFERTYTRFLDLKKAEAQAIRAEQDLLSIKAARQKAEEALTELKATQTQLIQQEKLASLGQLTAGIAHEIKNPLNFVNNFSEVSMELIEEALEEVEAVKARHAMSPDSVVSPDHEGLDEIKDILADVKANLAKIHEHGSRADGIVTSMLQHSRGGSGKMEPTDLNALIKEYVNLSFHGMRAGKNPINVDIQLDLDEEISSVNLISEDFSRVVLNLVNNAFDAMREKTKTDSEYRPVLSISTKQKEETVEIAIADNGPGIPDAIKDKILQPFFTTKKGTEGTGLGLSITHDIVKAHGGELKVETIEGKGTEFIITLFI